MVPQRGRAALGATFDPSAKVPPGNVFIPLVWKKLPFMVLFVINDHKVFLDSASKQEKLDSNSKLRVFKKNSRYKFMKRKTNNPK